MGLKQHAPRTALSSQSRRAVLVFLLLQFFGGAMVCQAVQRPLIIEMLNVGEGDSLLLQAPNETTALIDTGNPESGMRVVKDLLKRPAFQIDHLILTHPHLDHTGGVFGILALLDVGRVYDNGDVLRRTEKDEPVFRWYEEAVRKRPGYKRLIRGEEIALGDVHLKVLSPSPAALSKDWNENSLVLLVQYGQFKALLMGDANKDTEKFLLEQDAIPKGVQIVKAAHHGKSDTASKKFLNQARPRVVLVSAAENAAAGADVIPSPDTIRRYETAGATIFRTANGTVRVEAFTTGSFRIKQGEKVKAF